jgi:ATP-dependent Clp protease protease subunit
MTNFLNDMDSERTLFYFNFFDQETSKTLIEDMLKLNEASNDDINIVINSYGGEVYSLFAILDTINNIKAKVNTVCLGEADSCGAVLLSAGTGKRYIGENSRTMIHEVSTFVYGKVSQVEEELVDAKQVNDKLIGILAANTKQSISFLTEIMKKDVFLNANQSKDMGLVDEVISQKDENNIIQFSSTAYNEVYKYAASNTRDHILFNVIKNKKKGGEKKMTTLPVDSKGDKVMTKDEMVNALKESFGIDVNSVTSSLVKVQSELKVSQDTVAELEAKLQASIKAQAEKELEDLLTSMIDEGKSSQVLNDAVYREAFKAVGIEKAKVMVAAMPNIVKLTPKTDTKGDDENSTDHEKEDQLIKDLMKEKNLDYVAAAKAYFNKKGRDQ